MPVDAIPVRFPKREMVGALAYAVFYSGLAALTGQLILRWPSPVLGSASFTNDAWYMFFFKTTFLLILPSVGFLAFGYRPRDLLFGWKPGRGQGVTILLSYLAGSSLNLLQGQLGLAIKALGGTEGCRTTLRIAAGVLAPLLTAAVPEELFFRGILQTRVEAVWGRLVAVLLSNTLFAAWHLPTRFLLAHGVEGTAGDLSSVLMGTGLPVFLVGLVFSLFWDRTRNLPALVAAHWGMDTLPTICSFLGVSR